jgi:hypothetical protein
MENGPEREGHQHMKRHWLLIGVAALATVLAFGAVACEEDEDDGGDATATQPAGETPAGETTPDGGTPSAAGVEVTMNENEGSGVTGSATLTGGAAGTALEVTIDSGLAEGEHASHIHTGTCAAQGPVETPLQSVQADASGAGTASTPEAEVVTTLEVLQDGNHYIAVHDLEASGGAVVSCGDIPTASA